MMKFVTFFLLLPFIVNGQNASDTLSIRKRNIIWTIPVSKNTTINGIAVGLFPTIWKKANYLNINGLTISATPIDPFLGVYALFSSAYSLSKDTTVNSKSNSFDSKSIYPDSLQEKVKINGLMISGLTATSTKFNGVDISIIMNTAQSMNGLAVSGLFNQHYSFKGVLIAGIRNKTTTGKGLQISLFNTCKTGKVVQIGLINKIGKRIIPFCNFQL